MNLKENPWQLHLFVLLDYNSKENDNVWLQNKIVLLCSPSLQTTADWFEFISFILYQPSPTYLSEGKRSLRPHLYTVNRK